MSEVIAISSAKGGVGKTTITANLGVALATEFDKNVLLIDGNVTAANLAYHFGINYPRKTIADFDGHSNVENLIYYHPSGVKIIPAPIGLDSRIEPSQIESIVNATKGNYDVILIDSAPSLGREAIISLKVSNKILLVSTCDVPGALCTLKTIDMAEKMKKKVIGVVLNRFSRKKYELTKDEAFSIFSGYKILSFIPESKEIPKSITLQQPLVLRKPNNPISIEFKRLAGYIIGKHYEPRGIFYNLKKLLSIFKNERREIKEDVEKAKVVEDIMREVLDVEKLKSELTEEIIGELKKGMKEDIKKEIVQKLKKKLMEKGLG